MVAVGIAWLACAGCSLANGFPPPEEEICNGLDDDLNGKVDDDQACLGVSAGGSFTCARRPDSQVLCWGRNGAGELGDGSFTSRSAPASVAGLTDAAEVSAAIGKHACARRSSGEVACWGFAGYGQLGDGIGDHGTACQDDMSEDCSLAPVNVVDLTDAVEISLGYSHSCARRATGQVACWGANAQGQLGDGSVTWGRDTPAPVVNLIDAVDLSVGVDHACAVRASHRVACWGSNRNGELGPPGSELVFGVTDVLEGT